MRPASSPSWIRSGPRDPRRARLIADDRRIALVAGAAGVAVRAVARGAGPGLPATAIWVAVAAAVIEEATEQVGWFAVFARRWNSAARETREGQNYRRAAAPGRRAARFIPCHDCLPSVGGGSIEASCY